MSELISINQRYNDLLDKMEAIRVNLRVLEADKLDEAVKELDKIELVLKQLEDLYDDQIM